MERFGDGVRPLECGPIQWSISYGPIYTEPRPEPAEESIYAWFIKSVLRSSFWIDVSTRFFFHQTTVSGERTSSRGQGERRPGEGPVVISRSASRDLVSEP
jgi:hypothetical protein